ncbi:flagellar motor protein MotB [Sphingobium ummariense]
MSTAAGRRNRWAISFADLLLLLLGFFILLQANGSKRDAMLAQVSRQFGGHPAAPDIAFRAADIFVPGEALLSDSGKRQVAMAAARLRGGTGAITLRSEGTDGGRQRFDRWDLAAARLGAVARALKAGGVPENRLTIAGLGEEGEQRQRGQLIYVAR